jgi:CheY-like chemotaxis protein
MDSTRVVFANGHALAHAKAVSSGVTRSRWDVNEKMNRDLQKPAVKRSYLSRVLCVEDNSQLLETFKAALEHDGFEVITACHGLDALRQFKAHLGKFDAIVTDNEMPQMNGFEFLRSVRKEGFKGHIYVMSGNFKEGELEAYSSLEISGSFQKPFNIKLLSTSLAFVTSTQAHHS